MLNQKRWFFNPVENILPDSNMTHRHLLQPHLSLEVEVPEQLVRLEVGRVRGIGVKVGEIAAAGRVGGLRRPHLPRPRVGQ